MAKPPRPKRQLDPTIPFTRAEARASGISMRELCGPKFQRVFYNLYLSSALRVTAIERARAALKVSPGGSYASHFTAGEIWEGWLPEQPLTHVSAPRAQSRCQRRGIRSHDINSAVTVVRHKGVPVADPAQTFLDLATELDLVDLVVFGDSMVRKRRVTLEQLIKAADAWQGPGRRLARRAARLVRKGVDSPMESRLRMLIVLAGLPEPEVNFVIRDEQGDWVLRFDLCYPALKLIIEYDGRQHAEDDNQWDSDIDRRESLDRMGWRLIVVRSKGVYVEPERTLRRIMAALGEGGCTQLPRRLNEEWRRYFPGRTSSKAA